MAIDREGKRRWVRIDGEAGRPSGDDRDRGVDVAATASRVLYGVIVDRKTGPSVARVVLLKPDGAVRWTVGFPTSHGYHARLVVALGGRGTAFVAYSRIGGDVVLRRLGAGGATTWRTTIVRRAPLIDLAAGDRGLSLLQGQRLTRFAA